jgi:hypothetical protein
MRSVKGEWVEVVIDAGNGVRTYDIAATKAGRRVEVSTTRNVVEVTEVTRTGQPVRTARFMASRVLALVEHPADEPLERREIPPAPPQPAPDW